MADATPIPNEQFGFMAAGAVFLDLIRTSYLEGRRFKMKIGSKRSSSYPILVGVSKEPLFVHEL